MASPTRGIAPALAVQSRDRLQKAGYPVEWHQYPMAHSVCPAEIADIRSFRCACSADAGVNRP